MTHCRRYIFIFLDTSTNAKNVDAKPLDLVAVPTKVINRRSPTVNIRNLHLNIEIVGLIMLFAGNRFKGGSTDTATPVEFRNSDRHEVAESFSSSCVVVKDEIFEASDVVLVEILEFDKKTT